MNARTRRTVNAGTVRGKPLTYVSVWRQDRDSQEVIHHASHVNPSDASMARLVRVLNEMPVTVRPDCPGIGWTAREK